MFIFFLYASTASLFLFNTPNGTRGSPPPPPGIVPVSPPGGGRYRPLWEPVL